MCHQALIQTPTLNPKTNTVMADTVALTSDYKNMLWDKYTRGYKLLYKNRITYYKKHKSSNCQYWELLKKFLNIKEANSTKKYFNNIVESFLETNVIS